MAEGTTTKGMKDKQASHAKSRRHMQRRPANRGEQFRDANAVVTRDQYGRPAGPVGAAGAIVGGARSRLPRSGPSIIATTIITTTTATAMAAATGRILWLAIALPVLAPLSVAPMVGNTSASDHFDTDRLTLIGRKAAQLYEPPFFQPPWIDAVAELLSDKKKRRYFRLVRPLGVLYRLAISSSFSTEPARHLGRRSSSPTSRVTSRDHPSVVLKATMRIGRLY
jgi:hypothetical protein